MQMQRFSSTLEECELNDLGYNGPKYTWTNCREAGQFMKERLDRATANREWCSLFREIMVTVLPARTSDHSPLLVSFSFTSGRRRQQRQFKYEASWHAEAECSNIVKSSCRGLGLGGNAMSEARMKLQTCQQALTSWSSAKFRNIEKSLTKKTKQLAALQLDAGPGNMALIKSLQGEID